MGDFSSREDDDYDVDGVDVGPNGDLNDSDEDGANADVDFDTDDESGAPNGAKRKRQRADADKAVARPKGHKSKAFKSAKNPERNRGERAQMYANKFNAEIKLRQDIYIEIHGRMIHNLNKEERAKLRLEPVMQQERLLAQQELLESLKRGWYNARNAIDLRACEALPIRMMERMVERLSCDMNGKRGVIAVARSTKDSYLTVQSNNVNGIRPGQKLLVPRIFPDASHVRGAADRILDGRRLFLAVDMDGAAWDVTRIGRDLLGMLAADDNLIMLPAGKMRGCCS